MGEPPSDSDEQELLCRAEAALRVPEPRLSPRQRLCTLLGIAIPVPVAIAAFTLDIIAGGTFPALWWWIVITPVELGALYMVINYSGLLRLHILRAHLRNFVRHRRLHTDPEDTARTLAGLIKADEYTRECLWLSLLLCGLGALALIIISTEGLRLRILFVTGFLIPALQSFTYARLHAIYLIYDTDQTPAIWQG